MHLIGKLLLKQGPSSSIVFCGYLLYTYYSDQTINLNVFLFSKIIIIKHGCLKSTIINMANIRVTSEMIFLFNQWSLGRLGIRPNVCVKPALHIGYNLCVQSFNTH